jgi:hypothetical protein
MNRKQIGRGLRIIYLKITLPIRFYRSVGLIREHVASIREASVAMQYSFRKIDTKLSLRRSVKTITELSHFHKEIEKALTLLKKAGL